MLNTPKLSKICPAHTNKTPTHAGAARSLVTPHSTSMAMTSPLKSGLRGNHKTRSYSRVGPAINLHFSARLLNINSKAETLVSSSKGRVEPMNVVQTGTNTDGLETSSTHSQTHDNTAVQRTRLSQTPKTPKTPKTPHAKFLSMRKKDAAAQKEAQRVGVQKLRSGPLTGPARRLAKKQVLERGDRGATAASASSITASQTAITHESSLKRAVIEPVSLQSDSLQAHSTIAATWRRDEVEHLNAAAARAQEQAEQALLQTEARAARTHAALQSEAESDLQNMLRAREAQQAAEEKLRAVEESLVQMEQQVGQAQKWAWYLEKERLHNAEQLVAAERERQAAFCLAEELMERQRTAATESFSDVSMDDQQQYMHESGSEYLFSARHHWQWHWRQFASQVSEEVIFGPDSSMHSVMDDEPYHLSDADMEDA